MSHYNYSGNVSQLGGTIFFDLDLIVNSEPSATTLITSIYGQINYVNTFPVYENTSNIILLNPNTFQSNDNILNSSLKPYFTSDGISFTDLTNNINFNIRSGSRDFVYTEANGSFYNSSFNPNTEKLKLGCLLAGTKIFTEDGYRDIETIKDGEFILSKINGFAYRRIRVKRNLSTKIDVIEDELPYVIQPGKLNCKETLYISKGHAIKSGLNFYSAAQLGFPKMTMNEYINKFGKKLNYYHIELECKNNENRRTNTLIANGVVVESFSEESL